MVYYIRFLKPPRFHQEKKSNAKSSRSQQKKSVFITALICITTDLGDDFLAEDVDLVAVWAQHTSREAVDQITLKWQAGSRQLSVSMGPYSEERIAHQAAVLQIRAQHVLQDMLAVDSVPLVISGCSADFRWQSEPAAKLIQRDFQIGVNELSLCLRIWEETGNSIARHIW